MTEWSILLAAIAWSAVCIAAIVLIIRGMRTLGKADASLDEGKQLAHQLQVLTRRAEDVLKETEQTIGTVKEWTHELQRARDIIQRGNDALERIISHASQQGTESAWKQRLTDILQLFELGCSIWASIQGKLYRHPHSSSTSPSSEK